MEDVNKALIMAGSILLAVILVSVFVATMSDISKWPEEQNKLKKVEQLARFNQEYEAFQKSGMYGVDVVSCLNKAKSHNEKYVEGDGFTGEYAARKDLEINVTIYIKSDLIETITTTAMQNTAYGLNENQILNGEGVWVTRKNSNSSFSLGEIFNIDENKQLTTFNERMSLSYKRTATIRGNKRYELVGSTSNELNKLLAHANSPKQVVQNKDTTNLLYDPTAIPKKHGWKTATWSTFLYSFKQKRFKCTNLEYSTKTGQVNKIEFEEI